MEFPYVNSVILTVIILIEQALNWRIQNKLDSILEESFPLIEKELPYTVAGYDQDGRPSKHYYCVMV